MSKITLIGTMHKEIGKCNETALYNIFEAINPDVIFEETTPYTAMLIYTFGIEPQFPEQKAIQKYIAHHRTENIPIDTLERPKEVDEYERKVLVDLMYKNENNKELHELFDFIFLYTVTNKFNWHIIKPLEE